MRILLPVILAMLGISLTASTAYSQVTFGKSYVNITKGTTGGTYEPGDILEIRATIAVSSGSATQCRYNDTIPANTTYIPGSLKILTNEGVVFKAFTDAGGDDAGMYNSTNGTLRINLGSSGTGVAGAIVSNTGTATANGTIANTGRPSFYGSTCIMSASYRIQINSSLLLGANVILTGGAYRYTKSGSQTRSFAPYKVILSENIGLCSNAIGSNAALDDNGTFGQGTTRDRSYPIVATAGYAKVNIASGEPNDGNYSIVNNLSPNSSTNTAAAYNNTNRVFGAWDITGDHTNAANTATGNPPVAQGTSGGYFVVINASYANTEVFQQPVSGLCSNTYYEFSAWFKNVCAYCACDVNGKGAKDVGFNGADSAGVLPNLTFEIDGSAYYSTGNIQYSGNWVKKGFIFKTAPGQTNFTITIRNNAPGGGGNDWAIDDITFASCSPELTLNPSPIATICTNSVVDINAQVRSYFDNYTYWRWEKSVDNGANWTITPQSGNATPTPNPPNYEYNVAFPQFLAPASDSGNLYRLRIATTVGNLDNDNCSFADGTNIVQLKVIKCDLLKSEVRNLTARLKQQQAILNWQGLNTSGNTLFIVEKSTRNNDFKPVGTIPAGSQQYYQWTDPELITGTAYYRIRINEKDNNVFSATTWVKEKGQPDFEIKSIQNPFSKDIAIELASLREGKLTISVLDVQGRVLEKQFQLLAPGVQKIAVQKTGRLPKGMYLLRIQWNEDIFTQRIIRE